MEVKKEIVVLKGGRRRSSVAPSDIINTATDVLSSVAPTKRSHGIHMVTSYKATEEGVSRGRAAGWMCLSLLTILIRMTVIRVIMVESSHPRCNAHSDCKTGEFCAPSWVNGQLDPGCFDCFITDWVLHTNRTQKEQAEQAEPTLAATFEAGDMEYWPRTVPTLTPCLFPATTW